MNLTLDAAVAATGASVRNSERFPAQLRVVTDTRTIEAGDTFLALRGERFDGHRYLAEAVEKGASALVIDSAGAQVGNVPTMLVEDTKRAYMRLAERVRREYHGCVIAITGSAGKTTTKHFLAQLLGAHFGPSNVLVSPANENNEIGVSKLLLRADDAYDAIVVEMGARHHGDIAELVAIAHPHVGVLTNVGEAHLDIFGSHENLANTKWGLFSEGAQAVLNANDPVSIARADCLSVPPRWFGAGEPQEQPGVYVVDARTVAVTDGAVPQRLRVDFTAPGAHNCANLAAAIAAAQVAGAPIERIVPAIDALTLPAGRYEAFQVPGFPRMIYDAYNANPSGMLATLDAFALEAGARRIAILSSMAELGAQSAEMHEQVGERAGALVDVLLVGGEHAGALARGAARAGLSSERIVPFATNAQAARWLREQAGEGDVVLLKGSRIYKLEEIVRELHDA
ncbi:MAG: UDP-N-acetylmuramoyl-tripeptide--D-alanyl-D-alanine ligase [Candidatus Eremiobacteraeota bacterium]|nr:UDP-N-acetylmuramoyl-tripeptide--D-alanyl-D-alanine ligase [Candidatus Eremiobacteraeota bacterium]